MLINALPHAQLGQFACSIGFVIATIEAVPVSDDYLEDVRDVFDRVNAMIRHDRGTTSKSK